MTMTKLNIIYYIVKIYIYAKLIKMKLFQIPFKIINRRSVLFVLEKLGIIKMN